MRIGTAALWLVSAGAFLFIGIAHASILSGSVSFNPVTDLFTYSYALNNTSGPSTVNEMSILIDSAVGDFTLSPTAHTDPPGTSFATAVSGGSSQPPLNEFGTFWQWSGFSVPVGTTLSGFSFTTPDGPVADLANNYVIFGDTYSGGPPISPGTIEFGHIVAPDLSMPTMSTVPEPRMLGLIMFALTLCLQRSKFRLT
jgi:hypothetical protein